MLQKLNERFQGVVAWIIITLIAITFTLFGVEYYVQARQTAGNAAAEVNGQPISKEIFNVKYERMRQSLEARGLSLQKQYKQQLIDELVLNQLSLQSAKHHGFNVTSMQADAAILHIPQFLEKGRFSSARYQQVLSSALFTHQAFQHEVQESMLLNQQRFAFIGTAFALPNEIESYIKSLNQKRNYRYVSIPAQNFLITSLVSPQELTQYYQAHAEEFKTPEKVSLEYIQLSIAQIKAKMKITEEEIRQFYTENQGLFTDKKGNVLSLEKVKGKIQEQLSTERAQVSFAHQLESLTDLSYQTPDELTSIAKQLNLSLEKTPLFSREGGQIELSKNPKVIQTAFSHDVLVGNNSEPIQLNDSTVVVVRVDEHQLPTLRPLNEVKSIIEQKVQLQKAQLQAKQLGQTLINAKTEQERNLLMNKYHLTWKTAQEIARSEQNPINYVAFSELNTIGQIVCHELADKQAYVVIELQKIIDGTLNEVDKDQLAGIIEQIETNDGLLDYELYIKQLRRQAKVRIN